ncbi:hypothetical protein K1719_005643 [Acacia pycnantha]|nr:hypothetical protein K1719_005643 [Acacia pycnantha]
MNLSNNVKGSMSTASSSSARKSGGDGAGAVDQFPAGLRVLVVDDDPTCLMILEKMLRTCLYEVTKCNRAEVALSLLREHKNGFDIVISDVHMPDMDGFKLLEHIGLEMDLPVIMMSADDSKNVVMKGVTHGACDYLIKPVRIEALRNIWQHVVRKKKNEWKDLEQSYNSTEEGDRQQKVSDEADYSSSANEGNWRNAKKKRDEEEDPEDKDDTSTLKKPRVVWSVELHQQFVAAVNQLGIDKAVPKKILELMNVPGLTRENVASHLQKYRLYLRRLSGVSQHQAAGQLPAQSLAALQAAGFGRSTAKVGVSVPLVDERNLFSFENPRLRYVDGQQQHLRSTKPTNLLHGIPTNMEPRQLANLHQSTQSLGGMNVRVNASTAQSNSLLMPMAQSQPRGQMLNENTASHVPRLPLSVGQPTVPNGISNAAPGRNGIAGNNRGAAYNPIPQTTTSMASFPTNQATEMSASSFPLGSTPGISSIPPKGTFQEEDTSGIKGSGGFVPSYDIFEELHQQKSHDWGQNVGLTSYDTSQCVNLHGNIDVLPSVIVHQSFSSPTQQTGQNRDSALIGKAMYSQGKGLEQGNLQNIDQNLHQLVENPARVKTEIISDVNPHSNFFPGLYGQDDLMSALLKQQEAIGAAENEFDFDGYSLDNIPV